MQAYKEPDGQPNDPNEPGNLEHQVNPFRRYIRDDIRSGVIG
jgi:hypothetical protein